MFRMIWIALVAASLLAGCGDAESKSGKTGNTGNNGNNTSNNANNTGNNGNNAGNNANNTGTNNVSTNNANNTGECEPGEVRAVVNGVEACYLSCQDADCPDGFECLQGAVCVAGESCETRAECSVDQECVEGTCQDHLDCIGTFDVRASSCQAVWVDCSDERAYDLFCVEGECTCSVNEVEVASFADPEFEACFGDEAIHRVANENCGWLVPNPR